MKKKLVTEAKRRDAERLPTGHGCGPSLSRSEQRKLTKNRRGPYSEATPRALAQRILANLCGE